MVAVVDDKREAVATLCRKYGVVRMFVFGSALRDDFRPGKSGIDLLVEFGPMTGHDKAHAYFNLLDEPSGLLGTHVDLVMAGAVKNRYIAREIARDIEQTKRELILIGEAISSIRRLRPEIAAGISNADEVRADTR